MASIKQTLAFDPRNLSNCALWLDAADTSSLVMSGSSVSQWKDKSGSGNHMNQYSSATAPSTSNLNGLNTVYFYTSDPTSVQGTPPFTNVQVLQGTNFQTTVNSTLFLVVHPLYVATSTKFIVNLKSRASNQWNNLYDINMGTGDGTNAGGFGSFIRTDTSFLGVNSSYYTINTTNLTSSEIVGTTIAFYKDASLYRSGTVSLAMPSSDNFQVFTLGAYLNTDVYDTSSKMGARAHFCEVIVFNSALTTSQRQQVEGYLAWKWGLQANLPTGHPFKTAPIAPFSYPVVPIRQKNATLPYFDPRTISGCQLWFDAADQATFTLSGTNISQWRDKSTNFYTVNQASVSNQPVFTANMQNGLSGIQFQSNTFLFSAGSNIPNFSSGSATSVFIAARNGSTNTNWNIINTIWFLGNGNNGTTRYHFSFNLSTTPGTALYANNALAGQVTSNAVATNTNAILGFTASSTSSSIHVNGSTNTFSGVTLPNANDATYFIFNDNRNNNLLSINIAMFEMIGFNKQVSTTERQQIEGYLAWKWGLQRNLPSSHPYATYPPNAFQLTAPFKARMFNPLSNLVTVTFSYTGSNQTFSVPAGKTLLYVYIWGAGGGSGGTDTSVTGGGGAGAMVQGTLTVIPGENLTIIVGSGGVGSGAINVYGGGGRGTNQFEGTAGSGGGRSAIRRSTNDLVTAGGGGGGSWQGTQGGSATFSATANNGSGGSAGGKGGSQIAGGVAGSGGVFGGAATAGSQYQGGNSSGFGGGGGGGYFGGGGASSDIGAGGGGGSSFINNLTLIPGESVLGYTSVDSISAANTSSPYYSGTVGRGGNKTGIASTSGVAGGNGLVVIRY